MHMFQPEDFMVSNSFHCKGTLSESFYIAVSQYDSLNACKDGGGGVVVSAGVGNKLKQALCVKMRIVKMEDKSNRGRNRSRERRGGGGLTGTVSSLGEKL